MTATLKTSRIDELMEQASASLAATAYCRAEREALQALHLARQTNDFERMARIVLPLQESRRQRVQAALDAGTVTVLETPLPEGETLSPGCYLVQPPLVGADARRYRVAALATDVPVAVVCREPRTQLGLCPIVAISPGITLRTKVQPPADPAAPEMKWFVRAMKAHGDTAIADIDPEMAVLKRVDTLIDRLDAIPDHEKLHQALEAACREAHRQATEKKGADASKGKKRGA